MRLNLGKPEFADTGWDRLKDLFDKDVTQKYPEEAVNVLKSGVAAALAGLLYGGLPAARHARQRYIQVSQAELYTSRVDAVVSEVSTGLSVYRDQYSLAHYAAAGAVTGGVFRLHLGLGGLMAGSAIGAVLGRHLLLSGAASHLERWMCVNSPGLASARLPTGALILGMQSLAGESVRERRREERRERHELRLAEWNARLQLTDELIGDLHDVSKSTEEDMQRIQELLASPQSEAVPQDVSRH
ncbi:unnamed protein product [Tetraodon nigroviridis]|uniref:Complex I assembly factor TIMMDC1, mitochondrial n=1 Tax=Tetraodon nigroviridis TaxID=99883 RepID=Q4SEF3_TETNG|nr:unnamed protein product [Tetraodon nigroviridis]